MNILQTWKRWFCCAWAPLYFSDSESDNSQKAVYETQDNSIVAAQDSTNLSLNRSSVGGSVNITATDHGAVGDAFHFASNMAAGAINANTHAIDAVSKSAGNALDFAGDINKRSINAVADTASMAVGAVTSANKLTIGAVQSAYQDTTAAISKAYDNNTSVLADAYKTAKAGEQKILVGAVVGLVALAAIKMGSK